MTKKRLKDLQELFLARWRKGVHGPGGFGKPSSFADGGIEAAGFDTWELAYGGFVVGTMNKSNAQFLSIFDPVVIQEMLDALADHHNVQSIPQLVEFRDRSSRKAQLEDQKAAIEKELAEL